MGLNEKGLKSCVYRHDLYAP